jgi:hypothetical protein
MSVSVSGAASVYYTPESSLSRASDRLFWAKKNACTPEGRLPLAVSVGHFTGVVYFVVEPDCEADVVLGQDWVQMCLSHGICSGVDSLPVYRLCFLFSDI